MIILKRLKNLWEIGGFSQEEYVSYVKKIVIPAEKRKEKPAMAQIIRRTSPAEKFLNQAQDE